MPRWRLLPQSFAIPLAVASVVVFLGGIAVEDELNLQTDPIEWVDQSSQTVQDIHTIEDEVGTAGELGVFIQSDEIYTDANMEWMHDFRVEQLDTHGPESDSPRQLLTANSTCSMLLAVSSCRADSDSGPCESSCSTRKSCIHSMFASV